MILENCFENGTILDRGRNRKTEEKSWRLTFLRTYLEETHLVVLCRRNSSKHSYILTINIP